MVTIKIPSACLQVFLFSGKRIFPNGSEKVFFQKKEKKNSWKKDFTCFCKLTDSLSLFVGFSSFFFFLEKVTWQILIFPQKIKQVEIFHQISPFSGKTIIFPNVGKSPNSWKKEVEPI